MAKQSLRSEGGRRASDSTKLGLFWQRRTGFRSQSSPMSYPYRPERNVDDARQFESYTQCFVSDATLCSIGSAAGLALNLCRCIVWRSDACPWTRKLNSGSCGAAVSWQISDSSVLTLANRLVAERERQQSQISSQSTEGSRAPRSRKCSAMRLISSIGKQ